uniref:Uncharacterized protein n=1 Tax=Romanomermis culicivorax TaxID=13658 RepID=A0A915IVH8_ROMCU
MFGRSEKCKSMKLIRLLVQVQSLNNRALALGYFRTTDESTRISGLLVGGWRLCLCLLVDALSGLTSSVVGPAPEVPPFDTLS